MASNFEEQFDSNKKLTVQNRSVSFVDVTPPALKSPIPIFIAPGWGETPRTFKELIRLLYEEGFRVISVTHPRHDLKLFTKKNISGQESQKAEIILLVCEFLQIEKVHIVAHSEGAINAVIAAHLTPALFQDILLVAPGGLVENESFIELLTRFTGNIIQGGIGAFKDKYSRSGFIRTWKEVLKYFMKNPLRSLLEGSAISRTHLLGYLYDLNKQRITIGVIHGTEDVVFPLKKMKNLSSLPWIDFHSIKGDHNDICIHPKNYVVTISNRFSQVRQTKDAIL